MPDPDAPNCRVCGGPIVTWPIDHPEHAICMDCCGTAEHPDGETGHQYEYERDERDYWCRYCSQPAPHEWYEGQFDW